jgi:isorenieratene synthase
MRSVRRLLGVTAVLAVLAWMLRHTLVRVAETFATRVIRWRLHGYRVRVNHVDTTRDANVRRERRVAVVGGGLAGISAAVTLAERGFRVTLHEANAWLGGKLGAWEHTFEDGTTAPMEHGFHAFFPNYHNLNRFLRRLGIEQRFADTTDYRVLLADGRQMSFRDLHRVPGLNLVHLARRGFFDWKELVFDNPGVDRLNDLLTYHPTETPRRLDGESYAQFADAARLPEGMRLVFKSFTRVFFAEAEQMSMAELVRSFHGYFLSHDGGLVYRHPTDDHARQIWAPVRGYLDRIGVEVRLGHRVGSVARVGEDRWSVDGEVFDHVVLAAELPGMQRVLDASPDLVAATGDLAERVGSLQPRNRYAVLRLWLDRDVKRPLPAFTSTDRIRALDSITTCHRNQAVFHGVTGSVVELHCYCVPRALQTDAEVRDALVADLHHYLPELRHARIEREIFYQKGDFTPYFVGMHARRPGVATRDPGVWLAGDWVRVDLPVMLMEGAFTSGLLAANGILAAEGLREEAVYSVPLTGLLHGLR